MPVAGGGATAVTWCGGWEQVVCANDSVVQLYDLRRSEEPLQTMDMPGVRCIATDDNHMLLGDTAGCLSLLQLGEDTFSLCSRLTVEHGPKKVVRQTLVDESARDGIPQQAYSATAMGTVQLWRGTPSNTPD